MLKFRRPSLIQFYFLAGHLPIINKNYAFLIFYQQFWDLPDNFVPMSPSKIYFLFAKNTVHSMPASSHADKGRMLWPRLNEKEQGLRIHACNTLPVTYRNFTELSTASVSQRR